MIQGQAAMLLYTLKQPLLSGLDMLSGDGKKAEIRRIMVQSQLEEIIFETLSRKNLPQKGLVEWLKMKAPSSSPSTTKRKLGSFRDSWRACG
jgi:hypothetical protein